MTYRQANSNGSRADVTESPTREHVPPPQSASVEHVSAQTFATTLPPSIHQFITQPASGQSAAAEHGISSGRPEQATKRQQSASSFPMWASVLLADLTDNPDRSFSGVHG